jgi:ribosomal protein S18 acetylase RimI-like enzyme
MGVDEIWLEVSANNRSAIALYSKSGFEKLNTIPNYYSNGSDALRMHLIITNAAAGVPRETGGNRS